jgi:nicotinate-nucleotide adenylyltransferase
MNHPGRPLSRIRRVAFFGGSFDPPHLGHLAVARAAGAALDLDTILFAPVGAQPLKSQGATASFEDRVAMTRLAIADEPGFELSLADAPQPSGQANYTFETLDRLRAELGPECTLFLLIGADSMLDLRKWHRAAEIPFTAALIVAARPGRRVEDLQSALPPGLTIQTTAMREEIRGGIKVRTFLLANQIGDRTLLYLLPELDDETSATGIRTRVRQGAKSRSPASSLPALPAGVAAYIKTHGLYR